MSALPEERPTCAQLEAAEFTFAGFFNARLRGTDLFDNRGRSWEELRGVPELTGQMDKLVFLWAFCKL